MCEQELKIFVFEISFDLKKKKYFFKKSIIIFWLYLIKIMCNKSLNKLVYCIVFTDIHSIKNILLAFCQFLVLTCNGKEAKI
jgi:hypothetical protein